MDDQRLSAAPSKAGRPPKPGRKQVHVWVPETLVDLLKRDAAAQEVPLGDRLAEILASHYSRQEAMRQAS